MSASAPPPPSLAPEFDVLGIGNAIVDVVSPADEAFLSRHGMRKGGMALIDLAAAAALYGAMPPGAESSGGSAANTCAVAAGLGARVAYLGKVAEDALGRAFRRDIAAAGVQFPSQPLRDGEATARCLILVTPDGQRTMNTYLGACVSFSEADVDPALVARSAVLYLEGYLFDPPAAQAAFRRAAAAAPRAPPAGGPARAPRGRARRARRRAAGGALPVGRVLRGPPPGGVPRAGGA